MTWKIGLYSFALTMIITAGCSTGKESTRTGRIHDVRIAESLEPKVIEVRLGDEVRWVNARNAGVRIVFIEPLQEKLACQKNFKPNANTAEIKANDYASLCFLSIETYMYNARMESPAPGGETNTIGKVIVE